ncbi:hypothetical protein [Polaromonas naphthalenivorans]|nr:hypothetical protein [Polaromonas naphthalenivorans]
MIASFTQLSCFRNQLFDRSYALQRFVLVYGGINKCKFSDIDRIDFLISSLLTFSCTQVARMQTKQDKAPAHDAMT